MFGFHIPSIPAYLRDFEPARLQALKAQAVILLASLGIAFPAGVDGKITAVVGGLATVLTWWQAESTRGKVYSPATAADLLNDLPPGYEPADLAGDSPADDGDEEFAKARQDIPHG